MTDTAMIQHTASVFFQPGTVAELRILDTPRGTVSGYFDNAQAFAEQPSTGQQKAPAVCARSICTPLFSPARRIPYKDRVKSTTSDKDIVQRYWFPAGF